MTAALVEALAGLLAALAIAAGAFTGGDIPYDVLEARYGAASSHYAALADGARIHYRDEGRRDGPAVVLVHGFGASAADWEPWAERLGERFRLIALDLPGHGLTQTPTGRPENLDDFVDVVEAVARAAGADRFVLVGSSLGGQVAWRYAERHGDRLRGLVLVDAAGWPPPRGGAGTGAFARLLRTPPARALLRRLNARPVVRAGLQAAFTDKRLVTAALIDRYADFSRAPGHRDVILSLAQRPEDAASAEGLSAIHTPTLVMVGADDALIPPSDGRRFADAIPGAVFKIFDACGHLPMEEAPDRSASAFAAFADALAP